MLNCQLLFILLLISLWQAFGMKLSGQNHRWAAKGKIRNVCHWALSAMIRAGNEGFAGSQTERTGAWKVMISHCQGRKLTQFWVRRWNPLPLHTTAKTTPWPPATAVKNLFSISSVPKWRPYLHSLNYCDTFLAVLSSAYLHIAVPTLSTQRVDIH